MALALLMILGAGGASALEGFPFSRENPQNVIGAQACGECHDYEYEAWGRTAHAESFTQLHKRKRAREIARRLGFKRGVKRDTRCLTCHFTSEVAADGKREIAKAGVSCESCHGAGDPWKNVHNDTDRDRNERLTKAISLGMRPPSDFYAVVSNCFQCHIVAFEDLVNDGKHTTGTSDFEMAERIDDIRHNFLDSRKSGGGPVNSESSAAHRRVLQVAGVVLRAEYSLRALAQSTTAGTFYEESRERAEEAVDELTDLASASGRSDLRGMARAVEGLSLDLRQSKVQLKAADQLSREARKFFGANPEGVDLAFVDALQSDDDDEDEEEADGGGDERTFADVPESGSPGEGSAGGGGSGSPGPGTTASPRPGPPGGTTPSRPRTPTRINASGLAKAVAANQLSNGHKTVKASSCKSSCHESESKWWKGHPHSKSAKPFVASKSKNVKIARALGISAEKLKTGNNACMTCHGTVVTGKAKKKVRSGVSCQSCHGSAGKFLKPHQDGEGIGYTLGMNDLGKTSVRAQVCAGCHIIDYKPLLEAGHPRGDDFDFKSAIADIKHWERSQPGVSEQVAAFNAIKGKRPIPAFTLAKLEGGSGSTGSGTRPPRPTTNTRPTPAPRPESNTPSRPSSPPRSSGETRPRPPRTPDPVPEPEPEDEVELGTLPPWPEEEAGGSVEDEMRVLQARLQQIYDTLFGGARR